MSLVGINALGIKINVADLSEAEKSIFSDHWKSCISQPHDSPDVSIRREPISWLTAYEHLTQQVTRRAIEANLGKLMMFHAAGLQFANTDDVIGFVAPSGTGKSTLTAALGKHMVYVSDEVVAIDQSLSVFPLQKPVSLIGRNDESFKGHLGPEHLELLTNLSSTPRLSALVLLNRVTDKQQPTLTQLPLEGAVLKLVPQMSGLGLLPEGLNKLCQLINRLGGVFELTYSDAADVRPEYLAKTTSELRGSAPVAWKHIPKRQTSKSAHDFKVAQSSYFDAIEINGHVLVLDRGQVRMLGELASSIWLLLPATNSKAELLETLETKFGGHENSERILNHVLEDLKLQQLIEPVHTE
ncbi:ATP-binding protein [Glutamicibacter arilaitensis]|uniref:ATP-binding protein n=1 Tax=Glutamicibacter arilaitensis TaxID=256701 RepID=UPI003FD4A6D0